MMEWRKVTVGYGESPVLRRLDLTLPAGCLVSLIGPNGCGKTTLLKTAARLLPVGEGTVYLDGRDTSTFGRRELARRVALLPQTRDIPDMTVETLALHGRFPYLGWNRQPRAEDREMAQQAMIEAGVWEYRSRNLRSLSGGERQKAYLAMTIAQNADWLLLDEPTTYLDIRHQFDILHLIENLQRRGKSIVMVLHDLPQALQVSQQVVLMQAGQVRISGTPDEVVQSGLLQEVFGAHPHRLERTNGPLYYFTPLEEGDD